MDLHHPNLNQSEHELVAIHGSVLECHQTPAGNWLCCAGEAVACCGRGFTLDLAVANWERAQELSD